jgi:predicted Rossmann fold flavoprotein
VTRIVARDTGFEIETETCRIRAKRVIVATGGVSWPQTGSTGDGYRFAAALGHTLVAARPALVPLVVREGWPADLAGVSVREVVLRTKVAGRKVAARGNLVFTYDGIGGSAPQDLSRALADTLAEQDAGVAIRIDLVPTVDEQELDRQLQEALARHTKKTLANILAALVPKRLAVTLCRLADSDAACPSNQVTKTTRRRLVALAKSLPLHVTGARPIAEATVTRGGVSRAEIDPRTMESRIRPGLYFAGEVIDADGPCGGYNLQMCFATGSLAGHSAADSLVNPTRPAT